MFFTAYGSMLAALKALRGEHVVGAEANYYGPRSSTWPGPAGFSYGPGSAAGVPVLSTMPARPSQLDRHTCTVAGGSGIGARPQPARR